MMAPIKILSLIACHLERGRPQLQHLLSKAGRVLSGQGGDE